ncbi:DUF6907 domain-containing protein [Nocardioides sp.]|uniref:DUF6907 domain-containing protein n=1 Tax=Nocardioides sp. TaxID=35761 RepID=UPI00286D13F3|nr:hypothetical protein [Nocardioides sp.]
MTTLKPTWLESACPPWCVRQHAEDDHAEDHRHQSAEEIVPVVRGDFPGPEGSGPEGGPVVHENWLVVGHRAAGGDSVWAHLGQEEGRQISIDITRDSAQRLRDALTRCLDRLSDHR